MQNPNAQAKVQAGLDHVVGSDRLPTWDDIPNLPYLNLILQETYRMKPLSPLRISHASVSDDVYEGMFIPKGTLSTRTSGACTTTSRSIRNHSNFGPRDIYPKTKAVTESHILWATLVLVVVFALVEYWQRTV